MAVGVFVRMTGMAHGQRAFTGVAELFHPLLHAADPLADHAAVEDSGIRQLLQPSDVRVHAGFGEIVDLLFLRVAESVPFFPDLLPEFPHFGPFVF